MEDKRQKALKRQRELVHAGKPLPPEEVDEGIHCIRDEILVELRELLQRRQYKKAKDLMKLFNVAQPAVERYEAMHKNSDHDGSGIKIEYELELPAHNPNSGSESDTDSDSNADLDTDSDSEKGDADGDS